MMDTRLGYFLIGCVIGSILGYLVRSLREIKERVTNVDEHLTQQDRNDSGFTTPEWVNRLCLFLVVGLTIYAAFASQRASNKVSDNTDRIGKAQSCTQDFLAQTIVALNARTTYSQLQAKSNVVLQKSQADFLGVFFRHPPASPHTATVALQKYFASLTSFVTVSGKNATKAQQNPYPTPSAFSDCVKHKLGS